MSDHTKVAKKILELEFVEMSEVMMGLISPRPFPHSRHPITSISQWTERFALWLRSCRCNFPWRHLRYLHTWQRCWGRAKLLGWTLGDLRLPVREGSIGQKESGLVHQTLQRSLHWAGKINYSLHYLFAGRPPNSAKPSEFGPFMVGVASAGPSHSRRPREVCRRYNDDSLYRLPACRFVHTYSICAGDHATIHCSCQWQHDRSPPPSWAATSRPGPGWPRR